ncbi:MAG: hypothetical protein IID07_15175, partial [Gemmatimonadetes bacterium]|nr:hypothetical protein [Gemmatimonadota bacterium]
MTKVLRVVGSLIAATVRTALAVVIALVVGAAAWLIRGFMSQKPRHGPPARRVGLRAEGARPGGWVGVAWARRGRDEGRRVTFLASCATCLHTWYPV